MFHQLNEKKQMAATDIRGVMGFFTAVMVFFILHYGCKKKEDILSGPMVAYISNDDHQYGEIYICKLYGNKPQRISKVNESTQPAFDGEISPEFSPDGRRIKFVGLTINNYMKVYDLVTKQLTEMERVKHSVWSPDGKQIAYVSYVDLSRKIKLINADGTNPRDLTAFYYGDTAVAFEHFQWQENENRIIAACQMTHNGIVTDNMVSIDPATGAIKEKYNLPMKKSFTLRGNKIAWIENDSVFIFDLLSKIKNGFAAQGDNPANPVISPDGARVAYTFVRKYFYMGRQYQCTDIATCNLNGFDRREITINPTIKDETKYKRDFYPFWLSNTELLYSAGVVYKVTDDILPVVEVVAQVTKANGQVQSNKK